MPYDLYGNFYSSERDALNAELAQVAEIDARLAHEETLDIERSMYEKDMYINDLETRIKELEDRVNNLMESITGKEPEGSET